MHVAATVPDVEPRDLPDPEPLPQIRLLARVNGTEVNQTGALPRSPLQLWVEKIAFVAVRSVEENKPNRILVAPVNDAHKRLVRDRRNIRPKVPRRGGRTDKEKQHSDKWNFLNHCGQMNFPVVNSASYSLYRMRTRRENMILSPRRPVSTFYLGPMLYTIKGI
jgi:hypothetical protein